MIYLAENLKTLRKQANITQEQFADVLGVLPQAVSRWESEATYPDITLLPTIANYFDVTLDELIGMEKIKDDSDLLDIMEKYSDLAKKGLVAEKIDLLREALKRYPNNYELMSRLVQELSWEQADDEKHIQNLREALSISERILNKCTDSDIRNGINVQMCYLLNELGETDKAIKQAENLPSITECSTTVLSNLYKDKKLKELSQWTILCCVHYIFSSVYNLADLNYEDESLSTEERITMMEKCLDLYEWLYVDGNYLRSEEIISKIHRYIASMKMLNGEHYLALDHIEAAADHAIAYDNLPDKANYTSPFLTMIEFEKDLVNKNYSQSECSMLYDKLQWDRYDEVRDDERFKAVLDRLKECM